MKRILPLATLTGLVVFGLGLLGNADHPQAMSTFFASRCSSCHDDDTATCNGCHFHRGALGAEADQDSYHPGHTVTITLSGGTAGGWVRGILYDHDGVEIARSQGPTGTGDDGAGDPVLFPVTLQAPAPMEEGPYTWEAAWFGANNLGSGHLEERVPITIQVEIDMAVEDDVPRLHADQLRLTVSPNPLTSRGTLFCAVGAEIPSARLVMVDASGRVVRSFSETGMGSGDHRVSWDGTDDHGRPVMTGTYFAVLYSKDVQVSRPVLVLR